MTAAIYAQRAIESDVRGDETLMGKSNLDHDTRRRNTPSEEHQSMHGEQVLIASSDSVKIKRRKIAGSHVSGQERFSKTFVIQKEAPSVDIFNSLCG